MLSKKACCDCHGQDSSYFLGWEEFEKCPYHHEKNPNGIIQMGLAENQLSLDLIESWLENHPEATGLRNEASTFRELALFQDYHGLPAFKNALADFMTKVRGNKVKFDPSNLVLTAGATSANEILAFCLAEPGEAFLLPTPYYPGFDRDLKWRTGVEIVPINCTSSNGFRITLSALEEAFRRALKLGLKVKGVLITNPSNPLGTTLTNHELDQVIQFIIQKGIHIISDEIYAGSVYDFPNFTSILEATLHKNPENVKLLASYVHLVCSLSKDLGLPGFRVGMIYSNNKTVVATATKMSSFGLISSQTQHLLSNMLSDHEFTSTYILENQKRLMNRKEDLIMGLENAKIKCLKSNAGLFCWVDMRHLLKSNSFEAEMALWGTILYDVGLNVSPGSSFHCSEPGWFRVCFANTDDATLDVALKRIKVFVESIHNQHNLLKPPLAPP